MGTRKQVAKDQRLAALAGAVTAYEQRFGAILAQELDLQARADSKSAVLARGNKTKRVSGRRRPGGTP
jgi:hypothetical protein